MAFSGRVTGSGITSSNNFGIWSDASGTLELIARAGDSAPGLVTGTTFNQFNVTDMNNSGQVAFYASHSQTQLAIFGNGIWAEDSDGILQLVVSTGHQIDVDNGPEVDLRTIVDLVFRGLNDVGQIAFIARFNDGVEGFFVSNAVASADFDHDGDVDGRDYLVWQRGGSPAPHSAGNLALWREQYAAANGGLTAAVQVPEPGTCGMLVVFAIATIAPLRCTSSRG